MARPQVPPARLVLLVGARFDDDDAVPAADLTPGALQSALAVAQLYSGGLQVQVMTPTRYAGTVRLERRVAQRQKLAKEVGQCLGKVDIESDGP